MQGSKETLSFHTWEGRDRSVHHIDDHWWYGPKQNECATSKKDRKISLQFMATENTSNRCVGSWSLGCSLFWSSSVASWSQSDYECCTSHPFGMLQNFWPECIIMYIMFILSCRNGSSKLLIKKAGYLLVYLFKWTIVAVKTRTNTYLRSSSFLLSSRYLTRYVMRYICDQGSMCGCSACEEHVANYTILSQV